MDIDGEGMDAGGRSGEPGLLDADLLEAFGLHDFVPAALLHWRPLVVEGMAFFLERLPERRLAAIVADQLALGEDSSPAARFVALLSHCPTLHKLGQVLARHPRLDPELRSHLQTLESMPGTTSLAPILQRIREELGDEPSIALADAALAEGSVAVVLPFTYREDRRRHDGVLKVLKPGVEARLAEELAILPRLATFLERRGRELGLPPIDYRENLASVRRLLTREVRLEVEQDNMRAAAAFYADEPRVWVPRVLRWSTPRMTAMERVFGAKLTDAPLSRARRRQLAETAISALLAQPFWTRSDAVTFHGDLHGGNLLAADDGRLAVIDWSLTVRLAKADREALVAVALGGLTLDAGKIRDAIASLGAVDAADPVLADVVERALDRLVLHRPLPGFDWLLALLDDLALRRSVGFPEDFALFRKTWLSLAGVIGDLAGEVLPDVPLLTVGLRRFFAELPVRLVAPAASADFSTHVSNADIVQLGLSPWLATVRYWTRFQSLATPPGLSLRRQPA